MTTLSVESLAEVDNLLLRYIDALDSKDMHRWLATFTEEEDSSYICTSDENVGRNLPLGLMYDDCRARLEDRVTFITKIWAGTFQDYRTRHFVQRVHAERIDDRGIAVRSNFSVLYTPENSGISEVLATGIYEDVIRVGEGEPLIHSRKAILDTSVLPRYLVYPL